MRIYHRLLLAIFMILPVCAGVCTELYGPVGVVDSSLLCRDDLSFNWLIPWKTDWDSSKIMEIFQANGVKAEVIGADVLRNLEKLKTYRAIMIPADHNYPDDASDRGISKNIKSYVNAGGTYILPMAAAHYKWRDVTTGTIHDGYHGQDIDFLGLAWIIYGDYQTPSPPMKLTSAGERVGAPQPQFSQPINNYTRAIQYPDEVYVTNDLGQPCLYATGIGKGVVIHYAGGLPMGPELRDWLVASYSAILKSGPDMTAIESLRLDRSRSYSVIPVAERSENPDAAGNQIKLDGDWELAEAAPGQSLDLGSVEPEKWITVKMPNTIQYSLFQAGKTSNPWISENYKDLQDIAKKDWYLRKHFVIPGNWKDRQIRLRFDGMDYFGTAWLDGVLLGTHEGMAGGPTFDVSQALVPGQEHELVVRLDHETLPQEKASLVMKSMAVDGSSYQWGNKFRTIGLWQPVRLAATGQAYLETPLVRTDSICSVSADLWAQVMIQNNGPAAKGIIKASLVDLTTGKVVWSAQDPQPVKQGVSFWERTIKLDNPKLWWPNGLGDQPLYRMDLSLVCDDKEADTISTRFGIRTLEMRRNPTPEGSASRTSLFPSVIPANRESDGLLKDVMSLADESYSFLFTVNGRPFYAKGASWLTSDDLLTLTPERESWLIGAAKDAGFNLFRLNGGCNLFETEQFYNLCDEKGILVWQELPFCWNTTTQASPVAWREQIMQTVLRLRQHPSLAVYVGGNEFNPYVPGVSTIVDLFREIGDAYDNRPFRMSSPGGGTYHAYCPFEIWTGDQNWYLKLNGKETNFVSEWSMLAYGNMPLWERILPKEELSRGPVGWDWNEFVKTHPVMQDKISESHLTTYIFNKSSLYGDLGASNLPDFVEFAQMAQADTYGYVFEQWRGEFPYKGGETVWIYNPIAPVGSWNIIDWFGQPLASYYSCKRANAPVIVAAQTDWFTWGPGDTFGASVFALNDSRQPIRGARVKSRILDHDMAPLQVKDWTIDVPAEGFRSEDTRISWEIPAETPDGYFFLELTLSDPAGNHLSRRAYCFRVLRSLADPAARAQWQSKPEFEPLSKTGPWLKPQIQAMGTSLTARIVSSPVTDKEMDVTVEVTNTGTAPAYPVRLDITPNVYSVLWSDNYFWLAPGETVMLTGKVRLDMAGLDPVTNPPVAKVEDLRINVSAWNTEGVLFGLK